MTQDFANEDTEADYGQAYEGFYSKYYDELEQFAKDFFIENYEDDVTFNAAYNDFAELLRVDFGTLIKFVVRHSCWLLLLLLSLLKLMLVFILNMLVVTGLMFF